jgi:hypothetical protein
MDLPAVYAAVIGVHACCKVVSTVLGCLYCTEVHVSVC